jgi:outer membrane usher protein FimD/PapC
VTKVEWMNPHARFYVDVKESDGSMTNWNLELGSPASLIRRGWTRKSLKVGDQITVKASLAKDGSKMANARSVKLADGTSVFGASSADKE